MSTHLMGGEDTVRVAVDLEDTCANNECHPLPTPFPSAFIAELDLVWHGISL